MRIASFILDASATLLLAVAIGWVGAPASLALIDVLVRGVLS